MTDHAAPEPLAELARRLLAAQDSILRVPDAVPASPERIQLVLELVAGAPTQDLSPLVEPFDGGAIVEVLYLPPHERHLVALVAGGGVLAAVEVTDTGEADALYAGMAERLGLLTGRCEGCGAPISAVHQVCYACATGQS